MKSLEFVKAHGIGNDFIILDGLHNSFSEFDLSSLAVCLCERHFGIGADGLILVLPSECADYRMRIINSDGSEAEMCGNGIRCFANYLYTRGLAGNFISVETLAGIKDVQVSKSQDQLLFTVNMGAPILEAVDIPVAGYVGKVINQSLNVHGVVYDITCVSMGNPHCVIFVQDKPVDEIALSDVGPKIEMHSAFPKKTNVEFVEILSKHELKVRVWERGAGITLACGTGACASVVAGVLNGYVERQATVHLPGGALYIDWRDDGDVYMTGPAKEVFVGKLNLETVCSKG
jgi:diaminopimelate epimerase